MGDFAIVELSPQESEELIGLGWGCGSSPGDLGCRGAEPGAISLCLKDEAVVEGGVVERL